MGIYRAYRGLDGRPRIIRHPWWHIFVGIALGIGYVAAALLVCWALFGAI